MWSDRFTDTWGPVLYVCSSNLFLSLKESVCMNLKEGQHIPAVSVVSQLVESLAEVSGGSVRDE